MLKLIEKDNKYAVINTLMHTAYDWSIDQWVNYKVKLPDACLIDHQEAADFYFNAVEQTRERMLKELPSGFTLLEHLTLDLYKSEEALLAADPDVQRYRQRKDYHMEDACELAKEMILATVLASL